MCGSFSDIGTLAMTLHVKGFKLYREIAQESKSASSKAPKQCCHREHAKVINGLKIIQTHLSLDLDQDGEMEFIERNLMKRWITGMLRSPTSDSLCFCDQAANRASRASLLSPLGLVPSELPKNRMSVAHARPAPQRRDFVCPAGDPLGGTLLTSHSDFVDTTNKFNGTFVAGSGYCPRKLEEQLQQHQLDPIALNSISFNAIKSGAVFHSVVRPYTIVFPYTIILPLAIIRPFTIISPHTIILPLAIIPPHTIDNVTVCGKKSVRAYRPAVDPFRIRGIIIDHRNIRSHAKMTSGTIAGIALGALLAVTIIMLLTFLVRKRRHRGRAQDALTTESHPYLNPLYEALSSSQALTCSDASSASADTPITTEARRHNSPTALNGAVPQPSAPYHEEENSCLRRQNEDLQVRVQTLEMQLQSPWAGDCSEEPPGYLE
ncbi:hypothetical protein B0H13DRAFT_1897291 [Mycena leptocephala]|nr:hypothetical protein B0H13DRAFT_1897291 [Mycena leptocephala]